MSRKHRNVEGEPEMEQVNEPETQEPEVVDAPAEEAAVNPEVEAAKAKVAEYLAAAQRIQADFENFRRRNESVRADAYADGQRNAAGAMLPVLDNLERAVAAAADAEGEAVAALRSGVELTLRQLNDAFTKLGVEVVDRAGQPFDPALENAVLQGSADDGEPGTVCQVLQKGYTMGGKLLRPAMVKVVPED